MKILITAATENELLVAKEISGTLVHDIEFAVTGIGITSTTYHTTRLLLTRPCDIVINIGIAGSFNNRLPLGSITCPVKEYFGDCGVQTPSGFSSLFDEQLLNENTFPFVNGALNNTLPSFIADKIHQFPQVTGVTLQMVSGIQPRIDELHQRYMPDIETMESAAFFYVCLSQNVPFVALRAISNKVEVRNKAAWNIPLALQQLQHAIKQILRK